MRPQVPAHRTLTIATPVRHTLTGQASATFSVLVALLLIVTLIGPSAFLIAEKVSDTPYGLHPSTLVATGKEQSPTISSGQVLNHSPDHRLDKVTGEKKDKKSSSGKKRPKGSLHSKDRIGSVFASFVSHESVQSQAGVVNRVIPTVFVERPRANQALPPQLLQRPPPTFLF